MPLCLLKIRVQAALFLDNIFQIKIREKTMTEDKIKFKIEELLTNVSSRRMRNPRNFFRKKDIDPDDHIDMQENKHDSNGTEYIIPREYEYYEDDDTTFIRKK